MDPTNMTDEQLAKAIEQPVIEEPESPEAEKPEEVVEPVEPPEEVIVEGEEETPAEEEQPISRREQLRVNTLLEKYGQPQERKVVPFKQDNEFLNSLDADPEVLEQLQANQKAYSDAAYLEGLRQSEVKEWRRDLKYEAPAVEEKFPFLNPRDTENFKPAAADAMNKKYLRFIGYNAGDSQKGVPESIQYPDVSYREFVESEMEFVDELASQKVAETTKNIVKQAASTGLRPDGSSAKRMNLNKAPQDMTDEELYAKIGQTAPKK